MKQLLLSAILATGVLVSLAQHSATIKISGTRLAYPVFQKWIDEYSKTHADVRFELNSAIPADSSDIVIASYFIKPGTLKADQGSVVVNRYVQLPIVNSHRSDIKLLLEKGFTEETFRQVYFADSRNSKQDKYANLFTVYTREKPACATVAFASHFGNNVQSINGHGVKGDDKNLLAAVQKDTNAVSYNNLGFIYDVKSKKVVNDIAIIPIDLNENGFIDDSEKIYNTLDEVVGFAERTNHSKIPTENVNVIYKKENRNEAALDFLKWVLKEGQQYNHEFGFLNLSETNTDDQLAILAAQQPVDLDAIYGRQN